MSPPPSISVKSTISDGAANLYQKLTRSFRPLMSTKPLNIMSRMRRKHFSTQERELFLQLMNRYKVVLENKSSGRSALRIRNQPWICLAEEFNLSPVVSVNRTAFQLKKFWSNIKNSQREVPMTERRNVSRTRRAAFEEFEPIEPAVAATTPNSVSESPAVFSSNSEPERLSAIAAQVRENVRSGRDGSPEPGPSGMSSGVNDAVMDENVPSATEAVRHTKRINKKSMASGKLQKLGEERLQQQIHYEKLYWETQLEKAVYERREAIAKAELAELLLKKERERGE